MKRLFLMAIIGLLFLSSSFFTYAQIQVGTQTQTPCRWDYDCRSLDRIVKIDQNLCIGNIKIYRPDHLLFQTNGAPWLTTILVGKNYTDYIQTGYKIEHKCGRSGFCEVSKTDSYADGASESCRWGCLITPVEHKGKRYYNFCVCMGGIMPGKPWCDYTLGNDVYNNFKEWTCEVEVRETMLCGYGSKCAVRPEGVGCWPIETASSQSSKDVQYALVIEDMLQPVYVVAIQNGVVVAKKPVSTSSAQEYVLNNGPINSSHAYAFAQQTGLTNILASSNASTTTSTTYAATGSYSSSTGTSSSSNSSWLSKIAAFFGFGRKTTSTTSASATASTYTSTYSTTAYPSYSSASSISYSTYSTYPRTYSAYTTTYYTPTYSTANYSYSTYTNYSYPSSYSYNSSYTNYKPSYTYSSYSSYSYPNYTSAYSNYAPTYSNYTYSYPRHSYNS